MDKLKQYIKISNDIKWKKYNRERYNEYMKKYMLDYRKEKQPTKTKRKLEPKSKFFFNKKYIKTIIEFN
jgi:hypothetical protein